MEPAPQSTQGRALERRKSLSAMTTSNVIASLKQWSDARSKTPATSPDPNGSPARSSGGSSARVGSPGSNGHYQDIYPDAETEAEQFGRVFDRIDIGGTGEIGAERIAAAMRGSGMADDDLPATVARVMETLDPDSGVSVFYFRVAFEPRPRTYPVLADEFCTSLDLGSTGRITRSVFVNNAAILMRALQSPEPPLSRSEDRGVTFTSSKLDYLKAVFERADTDGDGMVSQDEFVAMIDDEMLKSGWSIPLTPTYITQLFRGIDANADGALTFEEFLSGLEFAESDFGDTSETPLRFRASVKEDAALRAMHVLQRDLEDERQSTHAKTIELRSKQASLESFWQEAQEAQEEKLDRMARQEEKLIAEIRRLESEAFYSKQREAGLADEVAALKQANKREAIEYSKRERDIESELEEVAAAAETRAQQLTDENRELAAALQAAEAESSSLREQLSAALGREAELRTTTEVAKMSGQLADLAKIAALEREVEELTYAAEDVRSELRSERKLRSASETVDGFIDDTPELGMSQASELAAAKVALDDSIKGRVAAEANAAELKRLYEDATRRVEELVDELAITREQLATARDAEAPAKLAKELAVAKAINDSSEAEQRVLTVKLSTAQSLADERAKELKSVQNELAHIRAKAAEEARVNEELIDQSAAALEAANVDLLALQERVEHDSVNTDDLESSEKVRRRSSGFINPVTPTHSEKSAVAQMEVLRRRLQATRALLSDTERRHEQDSAELVKTRAEAAKLSAVFATEQLKTSELRQRVADLEQAISDKAMVEARLREMESESAYAKLERELAATKARVHMQVSDALAKAKEAMTKALAQERAVTDAAVRRIHEAVRMTIAAERGQTSQLIQQVKMAIDSAIVDERAATNAVVLRLRRDLQRKLAERQALLSHRAAMVRAGANTVGLDARVKILEREASCIVQSLQAGIPGRAAAVRAAVTESPEC